MSIAVSIIVPSYNQAHFLGDALQSILMQTFKDWEAIIVNDGSTDGTAELAFQFADPRIHYIFQENRGLAGARNTGIRASQAEIIALLDSDDLWSPLFLERMVPCLQGHPDAAGVYSGFQFIDSLGQPVGNPVIRTVPPEKFRHTLINWGNWIVPSAVVFRKRFAEDAGLFDESLKALEDSDLWIRLSAQKAFVGLPESLAFYRRHGENMTKDPLRMVSAEYHLTEKLYGSDEGDHHSWAQSKKIGYAHFFQSASRRWLKAGDFERSAEYVGKMADLLPAYACLMGVWRGMAHAHIPLEHHDNPENYDRQLAERDILAILSALKTKPHLLGSQADFLPQLTASAYIALARDAVETRRFWNGFQWLVRAAAIYPSALLTRPYWGTSYRAVRAIFGLNRV